MPTGRLASHLSPLACPQDASPLIVEATISAIGSLDWSRFLKPGEAILMHGAVIKPIRSGRARCLLLTDRKRLCYIEGSNLECKDLRTSRRGLESRSSDALFGGPTPRS